MAKEEKYKLAAKKALLYFAGDYLNFGYFAAMHAFAVDMPFTDS